MTSLTAEPPVVFLGEVHAYADRWPLVDPGPLAESIRANGLRFPIVLDPAGRLVDGRNRLAACTLAGVEPRFVVDDSLTSEEAIGAYIWDVNGERRDMSKGAKAMLAALRPGRADLLSKSVDVAHAYVSKARQVIEWCDSEVVDAVIADALPLNDAYAKAQQIKATSQADEIARKRAEADVRRRAEEQARRLEDLRRARPDLARLVDAGDLPLADALTVRDKDLAAERKAAEQRRTWLKKLSDGVSSAVLNAQDCAHPNNLADTLLGLAEFPHDPMFDVTPAGLRKAAVALHQIADAWEAQP